LCKPTIANIRFEVLIAEQAKTIGKKMIRQVASDDEETFCRFKKS